MAAIVAVALGAMWQAGLLFGSDAGDAGGADLLAPLQAVDMNVETPNQYQLKVGLRAGDLAPNFEFSDFDGQRLRLSDFRGRPVVVNFWASWCGPCKAEMPDLEEALKRYEARSLAVIGVNNGETYRTGQRFLDQVGVQLTAFAFDPDSRVAKGYAVQGMPTSYFIDGDGVITRVVTGALNDRLIQSGVDEAIIGWGRVQRRGT